MKPATNIPYYCAMYPRICEVSRNCGYAVCIHGSVERDLDLLAVPWVEFPESPEELVTQIAAVIDVAMPMAGRPNKNGGFDSADMRFPEAKPHGRFVWTIVLNGGMFVDFGVMVPDGWTPVQASNVPRRVG